MEGVDDPEGAPAAPAPPGEDHGDRQPEVRPAACAEGAADPIILQDAAASAPRPNPADYGALVEHTGGGASPSPPPSPSPSSSSEEDEALLPPGPVDPDRCTASGPGFSGGGPARAPAALRLLSRDARGRRCREGGAHVLVMVERSGGARFCKSDSAPEESEPIAAAVVDHGDGAYTATYSVPERGSYEVSVEVNGEPIVGSPFPVFFSAPEAAAAAAAPPPAGAPSTPPPPASALGQAAAAAGVAFPQDPGTLSRCALVAGTNPYSTPDTLKTLFTALLGGGAVRGVRLPGPSGYAFLELESEEAVAAAAARLTGVSAQGQTLRAEPAAAAAAAAAASGALADRSAAMFAAMMQQQHQAQDALIRQVAVLRTAAAAGARPAEAMEAAAAAARRVAAGEDPDRRRRRSRSRSRDHSRERRRRGRHDRDRDRRRSRSRSRDRRRRRHRSRSRSRSKDRRGGGRKEEEGEPRARQAAPAPKSAPALPKPAEGEDELEDLLREMDEV